MQANCIEKTRRGERGLDEIVILVLFVVLFSFSNSSAFSFSFFFSLFFCIFFHSFSRVQNELLSSNPSWLVEEFSVYVCDMLLPSPPLPLLPPSFSFRKSPKGKTKSSSRSGGLKGENDDDADKTDDGDDDKPILPKHNAWEEAQAAVDQMDRCVENCSPAG